MGLCLNFLKSNVFNYLFKKLFLKPTGLILLSGCAIFLSGCAREAVPGPDKQFGQMVQGAATGAGAGAVTGFQISAATGPGALIGAGVGAISGAIEGSSTDLTEDQQLELQQQIYKAKQVAYAQEVLKEHYRRRAELHPSREIYPADLFFYGDNVTLKPEAKWLIAELAKMNKTRLPYSRLVIAVYSKSKDPDSAYANHLTERRAREIVDAFISNGLEPRRLSTRPEVISEPILIDPLDKADRYNQAIEFIPIDR